MLCYQRAVQNQSDAPEKKGSFDEQDFQIIENFHTFYMTRTKIVVENSCGPDSLLNSFCAIYETTPQTFDHLDSNSSLSHLLIAYSKRDAQTLCATRIKLLQKIGFKLEPISIDWIISNAESNIESCVRMLWDESIASGNISRSCECGIKNHILNAVEIDIIELISEGMSALGSCFTLHREKQKSKCEKCNTNIITNAEYYRLVFIDLQPIIKNSLSINLPEIRLMEFPRSIQLNLKTYGLRAAVEHTAQPDHNVAHCLVDSVFFEYNDLCKERKLSTKEKITVYLLIYTLND